VFAVLFGLAGVVLLRGAAVAVRALRRRHGDAVPLAHHAAAEDDDARRPDHDDDGEPRILPGAVPVAVGRQRVAVRVNDVPRRL
jgi:hypothetical protein